MLFTPFEQFEIMLFAKVLIANVDASITNLSAMLLTIVFSLCFLGRFLVKTLSYSPGNWQILVELIYQFVFSIIREQTGVKGYKYFPHIMTIFVLILISNLAGLIPFAFTVTSHISVTFTLALSYFIAWIVVGVKELKLKFLGVFCPKNMPLWLLPLLICVEFLSFCLRPISLGVRLFANMLAGHILLHILAGAFIYLLSLSIVAAILVFSIVASVLVLEIGIGLLQAYIYSILLCIYLKDSLIAHA